MSTKSCRVLFMFLLLAIMAIPAGAAEPLQIGGEGGQRRAGRQTADDGHHLAVPPATLAEDADHPIVRDHGLGRRSSRGFRALVWLPDTPAIGGVHQPTSAHTTIPFRFSSAARWQLTKWPGWIS